VYRYIKKKLKGETRQESGTFLEERERCRTRKGFVAAWGRGKGGLSNTLCKENFTWTERATQIEVWEKMERK